MFTQGSLCDHTLFVERPPGWYFVLPEVGSRDTFIAQVGLFLKGSCSRNPSTLMDSLVRNLFVLGEIYKGGTKNNGVFLGISEKRVATSMN